MSKNIEYIAQIDDKSKAPELAFLCSLLMILLGSGFVFLDDNFKETILNPPTITGNLRQMGLTGSSVAILLITAIFKIALAEEIFFRGFIAKLFIRKINFKTGNIIQAVLFGIIHVLLLVALSSAVGQLVMSMNKLLRAASFPELLLMLSGILFHMFWCHL